MHGKCQRGRVRQRKSVNVYLLYPALLYSPGLNMSILLVGMEIQGAPEKNSGGAWHRDSQSYFGKDFATLMNLDFFTNNEAVLKEKSNIFACTGTLNFI